MQKSLSSNTRSPRRAAALPVILLSALPLLLRTIVLLTSASGYILHASYKVVQGAIPVVWRLKSGKASLKKFSPSTDELPSFFLCGFALILGLALAGSAIASLSYAAPLLHLDPEVLRRGLDARFTLTAPKAVAIVTLLSLVNSGLEEFHFRAWLDPELSGVLGAASGIGFSALMFAAIHVPIFLGLAGITRSALVLAVLGLVVAGVSWSFLARKKGGFYAAWISHGVTDALLLGWCLNWLGYV